jgi:hypothetical protein
MHFTYASWLTNLLVTGKVILPYKDYYPYFWKNSLPPLPPIKTHAQSNKQTNKNNKQQQIKETKKN